MTNTVKFNVLDFVARDVGKSDAEAYADSLALAKTAEDLGYHRFWFAEHHSLAAYPSAAPEIMITHFLARLSESNLVPEVSCCPITPL